MSSWGLWGLRTAAADEYHQIDEWGNHARDGRWDYADPDVDDHMNGNCWDWAIAHQRQNPHLRIGQEWRWQEPDEREEPEDEWQAIHAFTHDDHWAYDARGAFPLADWRKWKGWDDVTFNHEPREIGGGSGHPNYAPLEELVSRNKPRPPLPVAPEMVKGGDGWRIASTNGIRYAAVVDADVAEDLRRLAMAWDQWAPKVEGGCANGCDHSRGMMGEYWIGHPDGSGPKPGDLMPGLKGRSVLHFTHDTAPDGTPELYVSGVHTDENHRRDGVAEALMRRLHQDHPGTRINPGFMTDMGQGLKDGLTQRIPGASDVLARLAAFNDDLIGRLEGEFNEWWERNGDPAEADLGGPGRGPVGHWPHVERFLKDRYPAAHRGHEMGMEEAGRALDGLAPMPYQERGRADLSPYEVGPEAEARHGYDPAEVAAGMVFLHNESHPHRGREVAQRDADRLFDIFQKRQRMQRDWEERNRTAGRSGGGDCYQAAGRYILDNPTADVRLAHGDVDGRGAIAGTRMGHAWIEDGDEVIDPSNGREVRLPRHVYYALGNIGNVARYTPSEAMARMAETEHFGPWHETRAAHTGDAAVVDHGTEWDDPEDEPWDADNDWIGSGVWDDDHREASRRTAAGPDPFDVQQRALRDVLHIHHYVTQGEHPDGTGQTVAVHPAAHDPALTNHWAAEIIHPQPLSGPFGRLVRHSTGRYVRALSSATAEGADPASSAARLEDARNALHVELQHNGHIQVPRVSAFSPMPNPADVRRLAAINPRLAIGMEARPGRAQNAGHSAAYQINCQRCCLALDARHRGLNVEAGPNYHHPGDPDSDLQWTDGYLAALWRDHHGMPAQWIDAEDQFQLTAPGPAHWDLMTDHISLWGPGARALVATTQADPTDPAGKPPFRHVTMARVGRGGRVEYVDPQVPRQDSSDWRDRVVYGGHPMLFTTADRAAAERLEPHPIGKIMIRNMLYSPLRFMRVDDKRLHDEAAQHLVDRGTAGPAPIDPLAGMMAP